MNRPDLRLVPWDSLKGLGYPEEMRPIYSRLSQLLLRDKDPNPMHLREVAMLLDGWVGRTGSAEREVSLKWQISEIDSVADGLEGSQQQEDRRGTL